MGLGGSWGERQSDLPEPPQPGNGSAGLDTGQALGQTALVGEAHVGGMSPHREWGSSEQASLCSRDPTTRGLAPPELPPGLTQDPPSSHSLSRPRPCPPSLLPASSRSSSSSLKRSHSPKAQRVLGHPRRSRLRERRPPKRSKTSPRARRTPR